MVIYSDNYREKSECDKLLKVFSQEDMTNFLQCGKFSEFLELNKYESLCILYGLSRFDRLLLCLHMFACLMILSVDRTIKYAEAFSMQC